MNDLYHAVYGREMMLHFPFFMDQDESFEQRQINLIDHCLSGMAELPGKTLLEVGCGNGANCKYISRVCDSVDIIGIDLNEENLEIANKSNLSPNVQFIHDDAQKLDHIADQSVDLLICIESAFHYPDKHAFFRQIKRVLKPGGEFLVADNLRRTEDKGRSLWWWKRAMLLHHANEKAYMGYASGNELKYNKSQDITGEIVKGFEGNKKWIPRENRSWGNFVLLRITLAILIRFYLRGLRLHKKYMIFAGVHA